MSASSVLSIVGREHEPAAIDQDHLDRMTLGDRLLECEVLKIFVRQVAMLLERIAGEDRALAAASAHTLLGSARGIGAWRVARAAEWVEHVANRRTDAIALAQAVAELKAASIEVSAAVNMRLVEVARDH